MATVRDTAGNRRDATELIVSVLAKLDDESKKALANFALGMQVASQTAALHKYDRSS